MLILLTNDDGIYAPGLAALKQALEALGDVFVVAPATEQSGVGHAITYLRPLIVKEVYQGDRPFGYAVEGSPADCVKLGVNELCPRSPDMVVSGINGGLNAGINVLYSGTVAAAVEGAFFGILSVAVSLEFDENPPFERAAAHAVQIIQHIASDWRDVGARLFNVNIPLQAAADDSPEVRVVAMDVGRYGGDYEKRTDPWGRTYYWATGEPPPRRDAPGTDLLALAQGKISVTPLHYDLTARNALEEIAQRGFVLTSRPKAPLKPASPGGNQTLVLRASRRAPRAGAAKREGG
ncbi:MAG: 5'/3'-nucleotidase SurE [Thermogutta sp.]|nr:5'/3'-nucleotidase SurE [Thermogutta sp.]